MAVYLVRTTIQPTVEFEVDAEEYERLQHLNLLLNDPVDATVPLFDQSVAELVSDQFSATAQAVVTTAGVVPATSTTRGVLRLTGDLSGTADSPTVPGLASKVSTGDARLSDNRVPTDGSVTNAKVATGAAIALSKLATDPLARSNHTGTQVSSTISDLGEAVQDIVGAFITGGSNVTATYNDATNTLTISASVSPTTDANALWALNMGSEATKDGMRIYGASGTPSGQIFQVLDRLGQPIFSVPVAGGPGVYGDNFRVHAGTDIFNPEVALRKDGSVQARKGDLGGAVGGVAIGAATTPPTRNPDGTATGTQLGNVLWVDANGRLWSRRGTGPTDVIGGNYQAASAPTAGVQQGDTYHNTGDRRLRSYDGAAWNRIGLDVAPLASMKPVVGEFLMPPWSTSGGGTALTASQMLLMPVDILDWGMTFDRVGIRVVGAGVGGTPVTRHGLYADDGTGTRPTGAPLQDWGQTAAQTTANTDSLITVSWTPPHLGRYWLAVVYQTSGTVTTAPTYGTIFGQALPQTSLDLTFGAVRALTQTGVTGALPTIGTLGKTGTGYSIGLRRSA